MSADIASIHCNRAIRCWTNRCCTDYCSDNRIYSVQLLFPTIKTVETGFVKLESTALKTTPAVVPHHCRLYFTRRPHLENLHVCPMQATHETDEGCSSVCHFGVTGRKKQEDSIGIAFPYHTALTSQSEAVETAPA